MRLPAAVRASASSILQAGSAFVLGVLTARVLGPTGQGVVTSVLTVVAIVVLATGLGSGTALRVRSRPLPSQKDLDGYALVSIVAVPVAATVSALATYFVVKEIRTVGLLALTAVLAAVLMAARQSADACQSLGRTGAAIVSALVLSSTQLLAFLVVLATGHVSVSTTIGAAIVGGGAQLVYCMGVVRGRLTTPMRPSRADAKSLVAHGIPSLGYSVGLMLLQRVYRVVLGVVAGPTAVGGYAAAATLAEVARLLPTTIGQLLFSRAAETGSITPDVRTLRRRMLFLSVLAVAVLEGAAPLLPILLGEAYESSVPVFRILLFGELAMGIALMDSRISLGLGALRAVSRDTLAWVAVGLAAYIVAAQAAGPMGAAVATTGLYAGYALTIRIRRPTTRTEER